MQESGEVEWSMRVRQLRLRLASSLQLLRPVSSCARLSGAGGPGGWARLRLTSQAVVFHLLSESSLRIMMMSFAFEEYD